MDRALISSWGRNFASWFTSVTVGAWRMRLFLTRPALALCGLVFTVSSQAAQVHGAVDPGSGPRTPPPPIVTAAGEGDLKAVKRLYPEVSRRERYLALHRAINLNRLQVVEFLIERGGDRLGEHALEGALRGAVFAQEVGAVKLLCRYGADPNWIDRTGTRALDNALDGHRKKGAAIAWALIECGARAESTETKEYCHPQGPCIMYPLQPLLHGAVETGDTKLVRYLLEAGADVNEKRSGLGQTALFEAKTAAMARLLITSGADPDARDSNGASALLGIASQALPEAAEMTRILLAAGADPNAAPETAPAGSILMKAAVNGMVEMVGALLVGGAEPNGTDSEGRTALSLVLNQTRWEITKTQETQYLKIVELLLEHGARPEVDPDVLEYGYRDTAFGALLREPVQAHYLEKARECIASLPTQKAVMAQPSPAPAVPSGDEFTPALIVVLENLKDIGNADITFSPDGRWMAYRSSDSERSLVVYDVTTDTVHGPFPWDGRLQWSQDSSRVASRWVSLDVSGAVPQVVEEGLEGSVANEGNVCGVRDGRGLLVEPRIEPFWWPVWAIEEPVRYELLDHSDFGLGVVATRDGKHQLLVRHDDRWVRREWSTLGWKDLGAFRPEEKTLQFQGRISPDGRYLYYELSAGSGGLALPRVQRQFVLEIKSHPVRIWEIDAPVRSAHWHPNAHQLFVRLDREKGSGNEVGVISFPARPTH